MKPISTPNHSQPGDIIDPINWNVIEDDKDQEVWNRLTGNFWLPEKVPVSNDISCWNNKMTTEEQWATMQVFTGLTGLDTIQGTVGAISLIPDAITPHEEHVLLNIGFMEAVHAKSYSNIFMTLSDTPTINKAFRWGRENEFLQYKATEILKMYRAEDYEGSEEMAKVIRKAASVILESFLFYSGFYLPLRMSSEGKLTNTADIIRLIIRDEALTGEHELLTPQGWAPISEVTESTKIAQYDPESKEISFTYPEKVSSHFEEEILVFESSEGHVRQSVSPNHRMLIEKFHDGRFNSETLLAHELDESSLTSDIRFLNCAVSNGSKTSMTVDERLECLIYLYGDIVSERNETVSIQLPCLSEKLISEAKELSKEIEMGIEEEDRNTITIHVPNNVRLLSSIDELVDLEDIQSLWSRDFFDRFMNKTNDGYQWNTSNPRDIAAIQSFAVLSNLRSHVKENNSVLVEYISDHTLGDKVSVSKDKGQQVYCVQVPSTYLVTRNNGSVTLTGNCVHGYYIGYKFQRMLEKLTIEQIDEVKDKVFDLMLDLYDNEVKFTEEVYDPIGWTEDVKAFLKYNANKALNNLGYEGLFPADDCKFNPGVMTALNPAADENHDFFSGSGSSYVMGKAEDTVDDDWDF